MSKDLNDYFSNKYHNPCESYEDLVECCKKVKIFTAEKEEKWHKFFFSSSVMIEKLLQEERQWNEKHLQERSFEYLKDENKELHIEKLPENYKTSFANPEYSVKIFGKKFGQLNSLFYTYLLSLTGNCHQHYKTQMTKFLGLYCEYFMVWFQEGANYEKLYETIKSYNFKYLREGLDRDFRKRFSPDYDFYVKWVKNADLTDLRYLFYYGNYVSDNEIMTAEFLNTLPQEKIDKVMHQTAKAYIMGFAEGNKDYTKKKTAILYFRLGMERLARSLILELENKYGLKVMISGVMSGKYDQQYQYDHRFSNALYLDKEYTEYYLKELEECNEALKEVIGEVSGGIYFDPFGEKPFTPKNKTSCMKYSEEQIQLNKQIRSTRSMLMSKYYKRSETSFCIIGFPTPDIGKEFTEIFDKVIEINMLDHEHWLKIQQCLIDALDQADRVLVKGRKKNKTDIIVKLPKLKNPKKQTNFANCGATVNIPVGEVFNTPQLKGTNGLLHIPRTFLNSFLFKDLELFFTDGRISSYNCKNYKTEEANQKYIEENLMFPHKSLPIGEFAIGTNTLAYSVAKKYKIMSVLPILIIEKMGPHFAIGDTCYSREEDTPVYNPDGKEIISRDNEQSLQRKKDQMKAYLNVHTDITLPYDEIGLIQAIKENGDTINIVKNGRFVLKGTEELNTYFKAE
ncbi:MAG: aminopeptidase [Candidatus Cloacimonetes bacterium]|nr:aminopeptidase [Candidatus Cloacimonadota bacterium]